MVRLIPAVRSTLVTLDRQWYVLPLGTKMPDFRHFPGPGMIMHHPPSMERIFFFSLSNVICDRTARLSDVHRAQTAGFCQYCRNLAYIPKFPNLAYILERRE